MRSASIASLFAVCLALVACNNTPAPADTGGGGGTDAGNDAAMVSTTDAGNDAAAATTDSGCTGVLLTVHNVLSWCDVTINGGTPSGGSTQTVCVPANTSVPLVETAHTGFILGNWHHTTGDTGTGTGEAGTVSGAMSTAAFMTGASGTACAWVCCPFTNGTGCDVADPCP